MEQLNIVELIESNPITKLTNTYNSKLLSKIKESFTGFEQQLFISSFYCYLKYDKTLDFVVDLDNIWKWLGFASKFTAERLLEKHFVIDMDYKNIASPKCEAVLEEENIASPKCKAVLDNENYKKTALSANKAVLEEKTSLTNLGKQPFKHEKGGQNIKKIILTVKCFKSLCLKSQTKKASEIHEYYMKLEEVLQETLDEETIELKLQLEQKENIILEKDKEKEKLLLTSKQEKYKAVETALISQFSLNTECVYFGLIDNTNEKGEKLGKFGQTNHLHDRVENHRSKYTNFILVAAFRVQNKTEIENLIKEHPKIKKHIRTIEVNVKNKKEIIAYDDTNFTISRLTKYIQDIIHSKEYSIDNFNKLLKINESLIIENKQLKEIENKELNELIDSLKLKNDKQRLEINELKETIEKYKNSIVSINNETQISIQQDTLIDDNELTQNFNKFILDCCIVRKDVEVDSNEIIAQFRIWNGIKPTRVTNEAFNTYLKTRFIATRLKSQDKNQLVHGFVGVMLKPLEYTKILVNDLTENFIFETCRFSPNSRIPISKITEEYIRYKNKMKIPINDNELEELKKYLSLCPYVQKGTLFIQTDKSSHNGYYGLDVKSADPYFRKTTSSTGKKVEKIDIKTGGVINTWETIAKAAADEKIAPSKMSQSCKNEVMFGDYYYRTI